jgi:hypothetical protein
MNILDRMVNIPGNRVLTRSQKDLRYGICGKADIFRLMSLPDVEYELFNPTLLSVGHCVAVPEYTDVISGYPYVKIFSVSPCELNVLQNLKIYSVESDIKNFVLIGTIDLLTYPSNDFFSTRRFIAIKIIQMILPNSEYV